MHSGNDVTTMLLKFCSVWHGVCINWNENIHSVEPCVTHVPPPLPLSSPSPTATGGTPSNTGAQLRMGIFTQKTEKRRGHFLKRRKFRRGYPFWKGVYRENLKGKNSGGGTLSKGGLWGNFKEGFWVVSIAWCLERTIWLIVRIYRDILTRAYPAIIQKNLPKDSVFS